MTCEEYLNQCLSNYYSDILFNRNFELRENIRYASFASNIYTSTYYILKISCDRQIIETEIASLYNKDLFVYIDDIYKYVKISNQKNLNAWDFRMVMSKRLNSEEQVEFLNTNHDVLVKILDEKNNVETIREIQNLDKQNHYPK